MVVTLEVIVSLLFFLLLFPLMFVFMVIELKKGSAKGRLQVISDLFFLLSLLFLLATFVGFNRDFGSLISHASILLVVSAVGLTVSYLFNKPYTLFLSLLAILGWWVVRVFEAMSVRSVVSLMEFPCFVIGFISLSLFFFVLGNIYRDVKRFKMFSKVYLMVGSTLTTAIFFFFSTRQGMKAVEDITKSAFFSSSLWTVVPPLLLATAAVGVAAYGLFRRSILLSEFLAVAGIVSLFVAIPVLPVLGFVWAITFNVILFCAVSGLIFLGYLRNDSSLINFGSFASFLLIIVKYFSWFFYFLDKSIFFIVAGVLLLVVGWFLEKERRFMLSKIKKG